MIPMFEKSIMPYLEGSDPEVIYSQTVKICGVGESKAETLIKDMIDSQSNPTIATYAKNCEVHLRVTAKAAGEKEAKKLVKPVVKELKNRFGPCIYTTNADITLEKAVVDLLIANKLTVSTVESCTGGMLAARLINVSGVSDVYKSGYITYSNKAKRRILGIKKGLLERRGQRRGCERDGQGCRSDIPSGSGGIDYRHCGTGRRNGRKAGRLSIYCL